MQGVGWGGRGTYPHGACELERAVAHEREHHVLRFYGQWLDDFRELDAGRDGVEHASQEGAARRFKEVWRGRKPGDRIEVSIETGGVGRIHTSQS